MHLVVLITSLFLHAAPSQHSVFAPVRQVHRQPVRPKPRINSETIKLKRMIRDLKRIIQLSVLVRLTGYVANDPAEQTGALTALGTVAEPGQVAVDPAIIPLGSKIWIPNYGLALATDTGGGVRGNHIDLCFSSRSIAMNWGIRTERVFPIPQDLAYLFN